MHFSLQFLNFSTDAINSEVDFETPKLAQPTPPPRRSIQGLFWDKFSFELRFSKSFIHLTARETIDVITVLYLKEGSGELSGGVAPLSNFKVENYN